MKVGDALDTSEIILEEKKKKEEMLQQNSFYFTCILCSVLKSSVLKILFLVPFKVNYEEVNIR